MAAWKQRLKRGRWSPLVVALAATMVLGSVVYADETIVDGDGDTPVSAALNPLNFGTVCVGSTYVDTALVAIQRAEAVPDDGNNPLRVFANSATVTVSLKSPPDDSADLSESMTDSSIVLPSNWSTTALGTMSTDTAEVSVTLVPSASGTQAKNVFIQGSGTRQAGGTLTKSQTLKVNWTGVTTGPACDSDPPAVTHSIGTPSYTSGGSTYVTSATTLSFNVNEASHGDSGLSECTVTIDGPNGGDGTFTCSEGDNDYTLSGLPPAGLSSPPDGSYLNSASATDNFANTGNDSFTVILDNTAPTFGACSGGPFLLGSGSHSVSISASDSGSGLDSGASTLSGTVSTSTVGPKTVNYTAKDNLGNTANKSCDYSVIYDFHGFFSPVDNLPTFNMAKAGSGIPLKFDLSGDQGLDIFESGYPRSIQIYCDASGDIDTIEQTVTAGGSSLIYDATVNPPAGQYVYVWKTKKSWAGTCRQVQLMLDDGTTHKANFKFK